MRSADLDQERSDLGAPGKVRACVSILVVAAVLSLSAGCNGASTLSRSQYQDHFAHDASVANHRSLLSRAFKILAEVKRAQSVSVQATLLDEATADVSRAADDLASIKPPDDIARDNAAIVAELRYFKRSFAAARRYELNNNAVALRELLKTFPDAPAVRYGAKALRDLYAKGIGLRP